MIILFPFAFGRNLVPEFSLTSTFNLEAPNMLQNFTLDGDAEILSDKIVLLPPYELAKSELNSFYAVKGLKAWEYVVSFKWFTTPQDKLDSFQDSKYDVRTGLDIWWSSTPFYRDSDHTLGSDVSIGGNKPFDGLSISFETHPLKTHRSSPVDVIGRLSYLPSMKRYRLGKCKRSNFRNGDEVKVTVSYIGKTLKVITSVKQGTTWDTHYCIHSAPVEMDDVDRYLGISARNAIHGSKDKIEILGMEFYSLEDWSPTLEVPEIRKKRNFEKETKKNFKLDEEKTVNIQFLSHFEEIKKDNMELSILLNKVITLQEQNARRSSDLIDSWAMTEASILMSLEKLTLSNMEKNKNEIIAEQEKIISSLRNWFWVIFISCILSPVLSIYLWKKLNNRDRYKFA